MKNFKLMKTILITLLCLQMFAVANAEDGHDYQAASQSEVASLDDTSVDSSSTVVDDSTTLSTEEIDSTSSTTEEISPSSVEDSEGDSFSTEEP